MNTTKIAGAFLLLLMLSACQQKRDAGKTTTQEDTVPVIKAKSTLVDYKSDTYKIAIGENYKISDSIVDWNWAALADPDNRIDSTGKDVFMSISEPLIKYNNSEYLPSLHIDTDKNIITSFMCSVLFDLADGPTAAEDFLKELSKSIRQLQNKQIVDSLKQNGIYKTFKNSCVETFELLKNEEGVYDRFEYKVKPASKNDI
jgi:hypothetical protein